MHYPMFQRDMSLSSGSILKMEAVGSTKTSKLLALIHGVTTKKALYM